MTGLQTPSATSRLQTHLRPSPTALQGRPRVPGLSRSWRLVVGANLETEQLFKSRVQGAGWSVPSPKQKGLHPIAREAWESIHQIYGAQCYETPLMRAEWLRERADAAQVHLKAECKQASGSYRARGAAHKLLALSDEQLQRGVIAAGSVNHTLAVLHAVGAAAAARGIRVPARIFVPRSAPSGRAERLRQLGGQVDVAGADEAEAEGEARAAAQCEGAAFIDALSDPQVSGALGSIAIELLMQLPRGRLDAVFVPVGRSGGLLAGIAAVLKAADPAIQVVGVYPTHVERLRGMLSGPTAGQELPGGAAGLADEVVGVTEEEAAKAAVETVSHSGLQVDAATGVAVAGFYKMADRLSGKHVVIVVCGGNVSTEDMQQTYAVAGSNAAAAAAAPRA